MRPVYAARAPLADQHRELLELLRGGDPDAVATGVEAHLAQAIRDLGLD